MLTAQPHPRDGKRQRPARQRTTDGAQPVLVCLRVQASKRDRLMGRLKRKMHVHGIEHERQYTKWGDAFDLRTKRRTTRARTRASKRMQEVLWVVLQVWIPADPMAMVHALNAAKGLGGEGGPGNRHKSRSKQEARRHGKG